MTSSVEPWIDRGALIHVGIMMSIFQWFIKIYYTFYPITTHFLQFNTSKYHPWNVNIKRNERQICKSFTVCLDFRKHMQYLSRQAYLFCLKINKIIFFNELTHSVIHYNYWPSYIFRSQSYVFFLWHYLETRRHNDEYKPIYIDLRSDSVICKI